MKGITSVEPGRHSHKHSFESAGIHRSALVAVVIFALACVGTVTQSVNARAASCANEQIRLQEGYASMLPDCRAYEQVSPTAKNLADARGGAEIVQSSPSGEHVTFSSIVPFPGVSGSDSYPIYLSTRSDEGWTTQGILPPSSVECYCSNVNGWTEDLGETVVASALPLAPGGTPDAINSYLRDSTTGEYRLLASAPSPATAYFADATPDDSHILFEDEAKLLPAAMQGVPNLYEWNDGQLTLVATDAAAGPEGGARTRSYTQNTLSEDGSRVFFTSLVNGHIYMAEHAGEPQERTVEVSEGPAQWHAATPDGSKVLYSEGEELYRFDVEAVKGHAREPIAGEVTGSVGMSDDGSRIYLVKSGGDLYLWHDGTPELVRIAHLDESQDANDWLGRCTCGGGGNSSGSKSSRLTPAGTTLLFSSIESVTGYDNENENTRERYPEIFLYEALTGKLTCVSCNPTGARPTSESYLATSAVVEGGTVSTSSPILTRNLSNNGSRVFFETEETLLPNDTNGKMNVYEWEREDYGSCSGDNGNCLYLISTGQSTSLSYFGDASAEGEDVFFFTRQSLVSQDRDYNMDLYDARVGGGIAAQNISTAPCTSEEACRGAAGSPPALGTPSSAIFSGQGSLTPPPPPQVKPKPLTRAQKLAIALRSCKRMQKKRRAGCVTRARKRYGTESKSLTTKRGRR